MRCTMTVWPSPIRKIVACGMNYGDMRWVMSPLRLFAILAVWLATMTSLPAVPQRAWQYAQSENFEMFTSSGLKESQALLADFEEFHGLLQIAFGHPPLAKKRTTIVVFEYREDFEPYIPLGADGRRRNVAAYFLGHPEESVIAMVAGPASERDIRDIVYHEYVHHFFDLMGFTLPLWLNEGLADLFSTMEMKRGWLEIGQDKGTYSAHLAKVWSLDWLFGVQRNSPEYQNGIAQGQFYAQSWALVHFWYCSPEMFEGYLRFLDQLERTGKSSEECMQAAFGMTGTEMQAALQKYLKKGQYQIRRLPLKTKPLRRTYAFRRATEFERDLALLNLEARVLRSPDSESRLMALAASHPESPRPYEVLAAIAGGRGDEHAQEGYYEAAVKAGSLNSQVQVLRARMVLGRIDVASSLEYRMPEAEVEPLRKGLKAALDANPNHADTVETLAYLESLAAKPQLGNVELVQRQIKLLRDPRNTLLSLAVIRWRIKDYATCEAILEVIRRKKPMEGANEVRMKLLVDRLAETAATN